MPTTLEGLEYSCSCLPSKIVLPPPLSSPSIRRIVVDLPAPFGPRKPVTSKVTGFLGPNGAGKSTTMRLMLGLDNGGGKTIFDGKQLHEYSRPSKVVGILLEAKAFHPTRTPRNYLKI